MGNNEILTESYEKGISVETCIKKAEELIEQNGLCLFIMDVKGSKCFPDRQQLQLRLESLTQELNVKFDQYFPKNNLATLTREEKGFPFLFGDATWAGINNSDVIPKIVDYSIKNYPDIPFYYNVAKDCYDEDGIRTAK